MNHDDAEQRVAELKRQRAEPGGQTPQMPDARAATPREAIRCVMFEVVPSWKTRVVAIDIGHDVIWVRESVGWTGSRVPRFDSEKGGLVASASRAQVTATPAAFIHDRRTDHGGTMPVLIVRIPDLQPLTIGCDENIDGQWSRSRSSLRFWWRGKVPWVPTPAYKASSGDWLTLVENFGLAPYLEDKASAQPDQGGRQWVASPQDLKAASENGHDRRKIQYWFLIILCLPVALGLLYLGGVDYSHYLAGTPSTATVTQCSTRDSCIGTWSIGGVAQTGPIESSFRTLSVGSSLDVRVNGGKAITSTDALSLLVIGGGVLAFSILAFVLTRSRTGRLVGKP